jgi:hypothetical protein
MLRRITAWGAALGTFIAVAAVALTTAGAASATPGTATGAGAQVLTVSQVDGLSADGATLSISGSGYNIEKGIYVAFCVIPPAGQLPTPCGGGGGPAAAGGLSGWISSNPPSYGVGLATPYADDGSFALQMSVTATIGIVDCRSVACGIVTRADHTRTDDRSQDVFVPVTFGDAATISSAPAVSNAGPASAAPASSVTPTSVAPTPAASSSVVQSASAPSPIESVSVTSLSNQSSESGGGTPAPLWIGLAVAVAILAGVVAMYSRRRRNSDGTSGGGPGDAGTAA